jgi:hypothetical protein
MTVIKASDHEARRSTARARKLRSEASNCIAVALQVQEAEFSADLIDEAVKLARRAAQIESI